ncbi:MAG: hypothetical protein CSA35_00090 [Dethiosulfovibrio peptidovorans]|nr:MAG: hypothetical protein CSA35_00090 [Dethiosulfovibrio peptidovorans]
MTILAQQLSESELPAPDAVDDNEIVAFGLNKKLNRCLWWVRTHLAVFTSFRFIRFTIMSMIIAGTLVVIGGVVYKNWQAESRRPLGCVDQNAMMAIGLPSQGDPYFVYVSERRHTAPSSPDKYTLFPGLPVDSMEVSFFLGKDDIVVFSSAAFCIDWKALPESLQRSLVALQRGRSQDPGFLFGERVVQASFQGMVDRIPVFLVSFPDEGDFLLCSLGNTILLCQDQEDVIRSLRALLHTTERLGQIETDGRLARSFVEGNRRFRFYLVPADHRKNAHILPRRIHQGLSVSLLVDMALQEVAPTGREGHLLKWLTRKDGVCPDDRSFATESAYDADTCGDVAVRGRTR